jgi:hypothetical protein
VTEVVIVAEQERPGHHDEPRQCNRYEDHGSLLSRTGLPQNEDPA